MRDGAVDLSAKAASAPAGYASAGVVLRQAMQRPNQFRCSSAAASKQRCPRPRSEPAFRRIVMRARERAIDHGPWSLLLRARKAAAAIPCSPHCCVMGRIKDGARIVDVGCGLGISGGMARRRRDQRIPKLGSSEFFRAANMGRSRQSSGHCTDSTCVTKPSRQEETRYATSVSAFR